MPTFAPVLALSSLDGRTGFKLSGEKENDDSGYSVASAGDVNGDGIDDLIIGAPGADPNDDNLSGSSYVVFGRTGGFNRNIDLSTLDGSTGFKINGESAGDFSGESVASAGDINGDGFADLIIGASGVDLGINNDAGAAYVIFGKASGFARSMDLVDLDGTSGFKINGEAEGDRSGASVASAGDINGDGFDDLIIGAPEADIIGVLSGASHVVFGKAGGFGAALNLADLNGTTGFQINPQSADDRLGFSVASAGDVNGDGYDDLIIGAKFDDPGETDNGGTSYVVFGKAAGFSPNFDVTSLDGANGFQISGEADYDLSGYSVASAGDVNGDGFDDLIIGAVEASVNGNYSGASYVVFGKAGGFAANINLSSLNGRTGFQINGVSAEDYSGYSVASAGDINGDGFDDVIVGAWGVGPLGSEGASYVVFGKARGFAKNMELSDLDGTSGFRLDGDRAGDYAGTSVASAGDVNGDGFDDLIVGAYEADPNGGNSGASYVVFGRAPTEAVTRTGTNADNTIRGGNFGDTLKGLGGDDNLFGSGGKDKLNGGTGRDTMDGGRGNDIYIVDNKGDWIIETSGKDTIKTSKISINLKKAKYDGVENAELTGGASKSLTGDNGKNELTGNKGSNKIDGQKGNDTLEGGKKSDTFVFKTKYDKDTVLDFSATGRQHDVLDIRGLKSVKNYQDLIDNHIEQKGKHVIIDGGNGDQLKLLKVKLGDLDADHFLI